jgi:DNA (cytosine-5)-methyltransferase 1
MYGSDFTGLDAPYLAMLSMGLHPTHVFGSDNDPYVRQMLEANHHPQILYSDVQKREKVHVDFYFAGFPCQSFSSAGVRGGFSDIRGTMFFHVYDYIAEALPKVFVLENVKGLTTHDKGNTFATIMDSLASLQYNIYYKIMSPHEYSNWPQHRPRIFIIGIRKDVQRRPFVFPDQTRLDTKASQLINTQLVGDVSWLSPFERKNLVAHSSSIMDKYGHKINDHYYFMDINATVAFGKPMFEIVPTLKARRSNYYVSKLKRKLTLDEITDLQGFPTLKIVVSDSQYMKQLGNSLCIPLLKVLFQSIFNSV